MGYKLTKDAGQFFSATSSEMKAYYKELMCNVPKGAVVSVSSDGTCAAVVQHAEADAFSSMNVVTDLRSLRDALAAGLAD